MEKISVTLGLRKNSVKGKCDNVVSAYFLEISGRICWIYCLLFLIGKVRARPIDLVHR